jgi:MOSC domain-containing protein YiiM
MLNPPMRVISVNVSRPKLVEWHGQTISTGIFKEPVAGRVAIRGNNLAGDEQADLTVHGGPAKAVYLYPSEHYPFWRREYPEMELPWGMFGENLTTEGATEESLSIGDLLRFGTAELRVTQPRMPCYKLGIKFGRKDVIAKFAASSFSGVYFSVAQEGEVAAGDTIELLERAAPGVTIAEFNRTFAAKHPARIAVERILSLPTLSPWMKEYFESMLGPGA